MVRGISQITIDELRRENHNLQEFNRKYVMDSFKLNKELEILRERIEDSNSKILLLTNLGHLTPLIGPLLRSEVPEEIKEKLLRILNTGLDLFLIEGSFISGN